MSLTEIADIVGVIRDFALIFVLLIALVFLLVVYKKVSSVLDSVRRTMNSAEEVAAAVSSGIVKPARRGSGVAFGAGKVAASIFGLMRNLGRKGGRNNGK